MEKLSHRDQIAQLELIDGLEATYSPEDNKLRLYADHRIDDETYAIMRQYGFKFAPKQDLFVAPKWTPEREDLCIALAGEIEPEHTSLAERAAAKAERLEGYAANKERKANAFSQAADELSRAFEFGQPILVGHHSERKARKTQERMHNNMQRSVELRRAANYNLYKAESVERHANFKNNPKTRARRIKTLLEDMRGFQRDINHYALSLKSWEAVKTDEAITKLAYIGLISTGRIIGHETYEKLQSGELAPQDLRSQRIAHLQHALKHTNRHRWVEHCLNRLGYETDLLGEVERFEGELTETLLQTFARTHGADKPKATRQPSGNFELKSKVPLPLHLTKGETCEALELNGCQWRELMQGTGYTVPAKKKALPPILNFKAEKLYSECLYNRGTVNTYHQIELTNAEYQDVCSDYRSVRTSTCGKFRFRVCLDPNHVGPRLQAPRVAVFLTDKKAHPAPETLKTSEQAIAA